MAAEDKRCDRQPTTHEPLPSPFRRRLPLSVFVFSSLILILCLVWFDFFIFSYCLGFFFCSEFGFRELIEESKLAKEESKLEKELGLRELIDGGDSGGVKHSLSVCCFFFFSNRCRLLGEVREREREEREMCMKNVRWERVVFFFLWL